MLTLKEYDIEVLSENYLCNQCLSLLTLWVRTSLRRGILDTMFCDKVCQGLVAGRWFSPGYSGFLHQ